MMEQPQRSESVELGDSNSNQSCGTSRSSSRHSSVDIETNVDDSTSVLNTNPVAAMSVADSLSPVKPIQTSSPSPSTSSAAAINNKLTLNHHASHLYTIEAILGLNKGNITNAVS